MNKIGFNALAKYLSEHEEILDEVHPRKNGTGNLMQVSLWNFALEAINCLCVFIS